MSQSDHDRVEKIFLAALARGPGAGEAYIEQVCGPDKALEAQVKLLLDAHERAGCFLVAPSDVTASSPGLSPETAVKGRRLGHYTIRRIIASGGMGVVYEAVQEKPRRTVALKVMRSGIASDSALRRFEYESQILARLRHPNIAQVYEAGTHEESEPPGLPVPYFAMEYVANAKTIIEFAQDRKLSTRQRLELFGKVCRAIHHGHQRGIIHRDLKPGNILVDSGGEPKIIDFGVARATDSDMAVTTIQTDVGQLLGTLQYMSPEQCEADPHDLDLRSDVYALGVVLYELLCRRLPYDVSGVAVHEAIRVIREEPPTRPSTVNRTLRGDLETIALKALEKDRARRYQSTSDLGSDIERYLSDRPIDARPPSFSYQLAKFVRRNKALAGGTALAVVALVIGTTVAISQAVLARAEAAKALAIKEYLGTMISAADPFEAGREITVVDMLDKAVARLDVGFFVEPEIEAELRHLIGTSYASMSEFDKAFAQLRPALKMRQSVLGPDHPDTIASVEGLAAVLGTVYQWTEADELWQTAIETRRRTFGDGHPDTLWAMSQRSHILVQLNKRDEALALARRSAEGLVAALGEADERAIRAWLYQWNPLYLTGQVKESEAVLRRGIELARRHLGEEDRRTLWAERNLGSLLTSTGRWEKGKQFLRSTMETQRRLFGDNNYRTWHWMETFGRRLRRYGRTAEEKQEGEHLQRQGTQGIRRLMGDRHLHTAYAVQRLAYLENDLGHYDKAQERLLECLDVLREERGEDHPHVADAMSMLGWVLYRDGRLDDAEPVLREALKKQRASLAEARGTLTTLHRLGQLLEAQHSFAKAEPFFRQAFEGRQRVLGRAHANTIWSELGLARVQRALGRLDDAEAHYRNVIEGRRETLGPKHQHTLEAMNQLAWFLKDRPGSEKLAEAEDLAREAISLVRSARGGDDRLAVMIADTLAVVLHLRDKNDDARREFEQIAGLARQSASEDHWCAAISCVYYGRCLLELGRFQEAESVLLAAQAGGDESACEVIVALYEAWGKPEMAAEWRAKLPTEQKAKD